MKAILKAIVPSPLHPVIRGIRDRVAIELWHRNVAAEFRAIGRRPFELESVIDDVSRLRTVWRNDFAAMSDYLEMMMRMAWKIDGPFLECGSGLSTLLLGLIAESRGTEVWTIEHHPEWYRRMVRLLADARLKSVRLRRAPLIPHGTYSWYQLPDDLPSGFGMVICDGPPSDTPGGRVGLLPQVRRRLRGDAVVLLDDAGRDQEREILGHWQAQHGCSFEMLENVRGAAIVRLNELEPSRAKVE